MNRGKKSAGTTKARHMRRAELLLLEVQRDILELRVRELEKNPQPSATGRKLKRDPSGLPLLDRTVGSKRPKPEIVATMTVEEMFSHCRRILTQLKKNSNSAPFLAPVDPVALNCPDYFKIVKYPMDFKTITMRLRPAKRQYDSPLEFRDDMRQVFKNCSLYNPIGNQIRIMGDRLSESFEELWNRSNIEKMYEKRQEDLKRERALDKGLMEDGNGGRSKKMKTCNSEMALKKITQIQSRMTEVMSGAEDKMKACEADADRPFDFWQRRRLSSGLENMSLSSMTEIVDAFPNREQIKEGSAEMMIENVPGAILRTLWSSVAPTLAPDVKPLPVLETQVESDLDVKNLDEQSKGVDGEEVPEDDIQTDQIPMQTDDPVAMEKMPNKARGGEEESVVTAGVVDGEKDVQVEEGTVEEKAKEVDVTVGSADQEMADQEQPMDLEEETAAGDKNLRKGSEVQEKGDFIKMDVCENVEGREDRMNGAEELREEKNKLSRADVAAPPQTQQS